MSNNNYAYFYSIDNTTIIAKESKTLADVVQDMLEPLVSSSFITNLSIKKQSFLKSELEVSFQCKNREVVFATKNDTYEVRKLLNTAWKNYGKDINFTLIDASKEDYCCAIWYSNKITAYGSKDISSILRKLMNLYIKSGLILSFEDQLIEEENVSLITIEFPSHEKQTLTFIHDANNLTWFFDFIFKHANDKLKPSFIKIS